VLLLYVYIDIFFQELPSSDIPVLKSIVSSTTADSIQQGIPEVADPIIPPSNQGEKKALRANKRKSSANRRNKDHSNKTNEDNMGRHILLSSSSMQEPQQQYGHLKSVGPNTKVDKNSFTIIPEKISPDVVVRVLRSDISERFNETEHTGQSNMRHKSKRKLAYEPVNPGRPSTRSVTASKSKDQLDRAKRRRPSDMDIRERFIVKVEQSQAVIDHTLNTVPLLKNRSRLGASDILKDGTMGIKTKMDRSQCINIRAGNHSKSVKQSNDVYDFSSGEKSESKVRKQKSISVSPRQSKVNMPRKLIYHIHNSDVQQPAPQIQKTKIKERNVESETISAVSKSSHQHNLRR